MKLGEERGRYRKSGSGVTIRLRMKVIIFVALLPLILVASKISAGECMVNDANRSYFLRFIQSAMPTVSECDIERVADNREGYPRDLVGLFKIKSNKKFVVELRGRDSVSDARLGIISSQITQHNFSDEYLFRRYFVPQGEVILYEFDSGDQYILVVEF